MDNEYFPISPITCKYLPIFEYNDWLFHKPKAVKNGEVVKGALYIFSTINSAASSSIFPKTSFE